MLNKLSRCFEMQDAFNAAVNPQWKNAGYKWRRAMWVEAAEAADFVHYKWWKNVDAPVDKQQLLMELVDIFHFYMSDLMVGRIAFKELPTHVIANYDYAVRHTPQREKDDVLMNIDEFVNAATDPNIPNISREYMRILVSAGFTLDDVVDYYIGKNALNLFRLNNGYKTGSYVKLWGGEEDNKVLERILDTGLRDFDAIYNQLIAAYETATTQLNP
jgi:dimeric dUTPase (all-alpha-NTP-PPase superfamily)